MQKRLVAGILTDEPHMKTTLRAMESIEKGIIQDSKMITHQFPYTEAKEAFDFLWYTRENGLGVLLDWELLYFGPYTYTIQKYFLSLDTL